MSSRNLRPVRTAIGALCTLFAVTLVSRGAAADDDKDPTAPDRVASVDQANAVRPERHTDVNPSIEGGYALRRLFDLGMNGPEASVGLHIEPARTVAVVTHLSYGAASTEYGLSAHRLGLDVGAEGIFRRVRFGGTLGLGYFDIRRATSGSLDKFALAVTVFATVDAFDVAGATTFIGLGGGVDLYPSFQGSSLIAGSLSSASLRLGVRF